MKSSRPSANLLEEALVAWRDARSGLIDEVDDIPAGRWSFRPAEGARSVEEMVVHVLEVALMMTGELTRDDTDFQRAPWPELLALHAGEAYRTAGKDALVTLLGRQLDDAEARFGAAGELHMLQLITQFDGSLGTRLGWLHHGIAQEMYHRGQLATYQRLLGREPALTRRIRGG